MWNSVPTYLLQLHHVLFQARNRKPKKLDFFYFHAKLTVWNKEKCNDANLFGPLVREDKQLRELIIKQKDRFQLGRLYPSQIELLNDAGLVRFDINVKPN